MIACYNGHSELVNLLLEKGVDVNSKTSDGWTALHFASQNGHIGSVKNLVQIGVYVDSQINDGRTALLIAAQNGHLATQGNHLEIVKSLLENGSNVNQIAILGGHVDIANVLRGGGSTT